MIERDHSDRSRSEYYQGQALMEGCESRAVKGKKERIIEREKEVK